MKKFQWQDVPGQQVEQGAQGVTIRWLLDEDAGATNFYMRHFAIAPEGYTPKHAHDWEHEVLILGGEGVVCHGGEEHPCKPGDVIFMPANEEHQFKCSGDEPMTMLCLVPADSK